MNYHNMMIPFLPYAHKPIKEEKFIFPITGLILNNNKIIEVGNVQFVDRFYLETNIIDSELREDYLYINEFSNVNTFAIIDLKKYGEYRNICKDAENSLALQILKQAIGAIYLSIYNKKKSPDNERRIIISDKGVHEVDEGLNSYMSIFNNKYMVCPNNVSDLLIAKEEDFDISNIKELNNLLIKKFDEKTEFENKICKSLEVLYGVFIESYGIERVIKLVILLNFIFREDNEHKFDSDFIGRKLRIIFNVIDQKKFVENIPQYICPTQRTTKKISPLIVEIFSRVRNNVMHGKLDLFREYAVLNLEDLIPLKVTTMELLNSILKIDYLSSSKTTKEFNSVIESKEQEIITTIKKKQQ